MKAANPKNLNVAIMCNGEYIHHWQEVCIKELQQFNQVNIHLIIQNDSDNTATKKSGLKFRTLAYRLLRQFSKPQSYRPVNIHQLLPHATVIKIKPIKKGKYTDVLSDQALAEIKGKNPDVILRFGFRILRGDVLTVAKYGIWSYHHCDEEVFRGGPAGFWEIYKGMNESGAILQKLTSKIDGGVILRKGIFKTIHHSYGENIDQLMYGSAPWVRQVCTDIINNKAEYLNNKECASSAPMMKVPGNWQSLSFTAKLLRNRMQFLLRDLFLTEFWNVGLIKKDVRELGLIDPRDIVWMKEEENHRYIADPFLFQFNGKYQLLYEWYDYRLRKARLALSELDKDLNFTSRHVLTPPQQHFSYPFVIEHQGRILVVPESCDQGRIDLFELDMQHFQLRKMSTLVENFDGVDSSLIFFEGKWWLFCTSRKYGSNQHLFLFHSNQLEGPYLPHRNNPVKSDIRSSRPAGRAFVKDGVLYRPAQNSAHTYGHFTVVNKVNAIDEYTFDENAAYEVRQSGKAPFSEGLHTLSGCGEYSCIDGKTYRFHPNNFLVKIRQKIVKNRHAE